jgi:putative aldouronate transport system permease protein
MVQSKKLGDYMFISSNYTFLFLLSIATIFPFLNMLAISLNDPLDTVKGNIYLWPREFTWSNYIYTFNNEKLYMAVVRSVIRTLIGTGLGLLVTAMIAYALSRGEFILRKQINFLLVMTLYLNAGLIPVYLLIRELGLMNNFAVYILPLLVGAYNIMIMRSYFDQLPNGVVESAKIDGANDFQVLFRIVLPMSMPVVATVTLFIAVYHWNSWFDNLLYTSRSPHLSLLQFELQKVLMNSISQVLSTSDSSSIRASLNASPQSIRSAITIVVTLPILFVYPFLQKYFVKGMTIAAIKE